MTVAVGDIQTARRKTIADWPPIILNLLAFALGVTVWWAITAAPARPAWRT
jgi:NitT/TauT family transport system permease protein